MIAAGGPERGLPSGGSSRAAPWAQGRFCGSVFLPSAARPVLRGPEGARHISRGWLSSVEVGAARGGSGGSGRMGGWGGAGWGGAGGGLGRRGRGLGRGAALVVRGLRVRGGRLGPGAGLAAGRPVPQPGDLRRPLRLGVLLPLLLRGGQPGPCPLPAGPPARRPGQRPPPPPRGPPP